MPMARRKLNKMERLNLIPILDAIFIFIFFLLMSAQFIDLYEIGSDAPITMNSNNVPPEKKPLNLTLEISPRGIEVKTGLESKTVASFKHTETRKLNKMLAGLKQEYPNEKQAILKPKKKVAYNKIVKVIDATRTVMLPEGIKEGKEKDLFNKVVFEVQD